MPEMSRTNGYIFIDSERFSFLNFNLNEKFHKLERGYRDYKRQDKDIQYTV